MIKLESLNILKLIITAPSAQFRIFYSKDLTRTYPVSPYSTVIGLIANIIGNQEMIKKLLGQQFALGILCSHKYKSREYIWLRNLSVNQHKKRFSHRKLREWQGVIEHPGFQFPKKTEVLNDVKLIVYLFHPQKDVLDIVKKNVLRPEQWFSHLHLGRSEDWACIENVSFQSLAISNEPKKLCNASQYYQWMPRPDVAFGMEDYLSTEEYVSLYNKIQGNIELVTSLYKLVENPYSKGDYIRNFEHVPARIINNPVPFLDNFTLPNLLVDQELKTPVYMAQIGAGGEQDN